MPGGDRTGPAGAGPMTGRAAGYCAGYGVPGHMNPVGGRGSGWGRGFGRGFGRGLGWGFGRGRGWASWPVAPPVYGGYVAGPYGTPSASDERSFLQSQTKVLKDQLAAIQKRLDELATQQEQK